MTHRRAIPDAEAKRLAAIAKREGVRVRYQRDKDSPIIEIVPAIPDDHRRQDVDDSEAIRL